MKAKKTLTALAIIGVAVSLFATSKWGIGWNADSVQYISAAHSLLDGQGIRSLARDGTLQPLTHYPPLYSLLLATLQLFGYSALSAAKWLNTLLFGINIFVVGLIVDRYTRSVGLASFGSLLILINLAMLTTHLQALTEPLFFTLFLVGLLLLADYLESPRWRLLIAAAIIIGLAAITRYVGISLILTGLVALVLFCSNPWPKVLLFGSISSLPLGLWMLRNLLIASNLANREVTFHPIGFFHIRMALKTVQEFIIPFLDFRAFWLLMAMLAIVIIKTRPKIRPSFPEPIFLKLLQLFVAVYLLFLVFSISFIDAYTPLDNRMLSPIYIAGVILVLYFIRPLLHSKLFVTVGLTIVAIQLYFSAYWISYYHQHGYGFGNERIQKSELIEYSKMLPPDVRIFSNAPDVIYLLTGRKVAALPLKFEPSSRLRYDYESELPKLKNGTLIYFDNFKWRTYFVTRAELRQKLNLSLILDTRDGGVYELEVK